MCTLYTNTDVCTVHCVLPLFTARQLMTNSVQLNSSLSCTTTKNMYYSCQTKGNFNCITFSLDKFQQFFYFINLTFRMHQNQCVSENLNLTLNIFRGTPLGVCLRCFLSLRLFLILLRQLFENPELCTFSVKREERETGKGAM